MALTAVFQTLCLHCRKLHEAFAGLRLTIVEDKPLTGEIVLVDEFGNTVDDLLGQLEDVFASASEGQQAVGHPPDLARARHSLTVCQEHFIDLMQRFSRDLLAYNRIAALVELGSERRGEWQAWANSVKESIEECQPYLSDIHQALFCCWQEIAERSGMVSLSMQTTNIGPALSTREGMKVSKRTAGKL